MLVLVGIGWIIFRAESIGVAWDFFTRICSPSLFSRPDAPGVTGFSLAICLMLVIEWVQRKKEHGMDLSPIRSGLVRYAICLALIFSILMLGGHTENFIYVQF